MGTPKYYDNATSSWKPILSGPQGPSGPSGPTGPAGPAGASGSSSLSGMTDVDVTSVPPVDGNGLTWSAAESKWIPASASNVLVLAAGAPIPVGTPDYTVIVRTTAPISVPSPVVVGTPTTYGSLSSSSLVVPVPSGIIDGDYVIVALNNGNGASVITPPSGFSLLLRIPMSSYSPMRTTAVYGLPVPAASALTGTSNWTFGSSQTTRQVATAFVVRNVKLSDPVAGVSGIPAASNRMPSYSVASDDSLTIMVAVSVTLSPDVSLPMVPSGSTHTTIVQTQSTTSTSDTRQTLSVFTYGANTPTQAEVTYTPSSAVSSSTAVGVTLRKADS